MKKSFQDYLDQNLVQNHLLLETEEDGPIIIAVVRGEVVPMVFRRGDETNNE